MLALTREIALPGLALLTALSLIGCGAGSASHSNSASAKASAAKRASLASGAAEHPINMFAVPKLPGAVGQASAIRVGSQVITTATVAHWYSVLTPKIASYEPKSRADCSSVRAPIEAKLPKGAKLSPAQIKALCLRQKQKVVTDSALQQLISNQWVLGEASELRLGVSEAEAQQRLAKDEAQQFKSKAEFLHYISGTGRTVADTLLEVRLGMATERIQDLIKSKAQKKLTEAAIARFYRKNEKIFASGKQQSLKQVEAIVREKLSAKLLEEEKASFIRAFRKKWLARTSCSPGFIVSRCREFRGPSVLVSEDAYEVS